MDRKIVSRFALFSTLLFSCVAFATSIPNNSPNPKTFLGPSLSLSVTKGISEDTAFSIAGEGGPKLMRVSGTLGWELTYYQRLKATAEFLREKLTYSFYTGRVNEWMNQGALGLAYEYDFHDAIPYDTKLSLSGYVAHAPSKTLSTQNVTFINSMGASQSETVARRIAGSNAAGVSPGVTIVPWEGTSATLQVNYDSVRYDTSNGAASDAKGVGGTVSLSQALSEDVSLGLSAGVRAPFNDYEGNITWGNVPYYGTWQFKVYGAYTIGKQALPTTYNIGFGVDYFVDVERYRVSPASAPPMPRINGYKDAPAYKDMPVYKDQIVPPVEWEDAEALNKNLIRWTAIPAVRIPTVLTRTDQLVSVCVPPTVTAFDDIDTGSPFSLALNTHFTGTNLTYTIDYHGSANNGSLYVSNGNLIGNGQAGGGGSPPFYPLPFGLYPAISITATNACGSVTSNTFSIE